MATSRVLAAALEREGADLVLFGQQASDADGAVLWAAVAERLRRPVVSQAAELSVDEGSLRVKRQTEFGYDVIEAPLPAVVAVSDAINEPRYPSLKGIMGAKKKPQDVLSLADLGVDASAAGEAGSKTEVLALSDPPPRGGARKIEDDGNAAAGDRRLPRREEAHLMATLVFLRAPRRGASEGLARRALEGGLARRRRRRRRARRRGRARARRRGRHVTAPRRSTSPRTPRSTRRCRSRASTCSRRSSPTAATTPCSSRNSVLAADVAAGLAARLDAGLNWDLADLERRRRRARRQAARARRTPSTSTSAGARSRGSRSSAPAPSTRRRPAAARPRSSRSRSSSPSTRAARRIVDQQLEESTGPSIEDAEIVVAGGRGLGAPEHFTLAEELAQALGGAVGATRAVVDAGWYPYSTQIGQTGKTVSPKLYVALGISGAIQHKVGMQSSNVIVSINKDANAPIFEFSDLGVVGDLHEIVPKLTELVPAPRRVTPR